MAYILRHMQRGAGKTAVSLILAIVLTSGVGMFVLARLTYSALAGAIKKEDELSEAIERKTRIYTIAGVIKSDSASTSNSIFAAVNRAAEDVYGQSFPFGYCEFTLADNEKLEEVNILLENQKKRESMYAPTAFFYIDGTGLENIRRICELLESLFPIAVAAALLIGLFGPGLVILQSAQEAAFLRVLGVTKSRVRCMLILEQIVLCAVGIVLVAGGFALLRPGLFTRSVQTLATCFALYFMGCLCGAFVAAIQVTRHKILELLQVKE